MSISTCTNDNSSKVDLEQGRAYWPELGEATPVCLFNTQYLYRSYAIYWLVQHDDLARSALKRYRIRLHKADLRSPNDHSGARRFGCDIYVASITVNAHRKLQAAGLCSIQVLLD